MKVREYALRFLITFLAALLAAILVTLLWNLIIEGLGPTVDWGTSFRLALIFAIVLPLTQNRSKKSG